MIRTLCTAAALSILSSAAMAQQTLVPADSEIRFTFRQLGVPVSGHFQRFEGDVQLHPEQLESSKVRLDVHTASATIGDPQTDAELVKQDWFDTTQFPLASFESDSIRATGGNQYEATGNLTIKGQSQEVTVPVTVAQQDGQTIATGTLPIERLNFKIGDGAWGDTSLVANEVQVNFKLAMTGQAAP